MYGALARWLSWLPGGLMHSNIAACAMFAATSGSSLATAATVGAVALPQAQRFGYNERLFLGTLAAGGTLGILIPPSINMIIYAVLTNTSVPRLYLAGIVPGVLLALSFMVIVAVACMLRPEWGGRRVTSTLAACIAGLVHLLPPLGIFLVVVGSIYAGLATPTEAASLGVMAGLALAWWSKALSWSMLSEALLGTMRVDRHDHAHHRRRVLPQLRHVGDRADDEADRRDPDTSGCRSGRRWPRWWRSTSCSAASWKRCR